MPFFDDLRTRQALGYVCQSALRSDAGVASLRFIVQSTKVTPEGARARVEAFLAGFPAYVAALPAAAFAANVAAAATARAEADKALEQEAARLWAEVSGPGLVDFERASREVAALAALSQADMVAFFAESVAPGGARRRAAYAGIARGTAVEATEGGQAAPPAEEEGQWPRTASPPCHATHPQTALSTASSMPRFTRRSPNKAGVPLPSPRTRAASKSLATVFMTLATILSWASSSRSALVNRFEGV